MKINGIQNSKSRIANMMVENLTHIKNLEARLANSLDSISASHQMINTSLKQQFVVKRLSSEVANRFYQNGKVIVK